MLELKNITYRVQEKTILDNINLCFDNNFTVITGPNGSGKSTLAKIIMGIVQPTSGQIVFDGKDITNMTIDQRANLGIAFAFQQPVKFKGITVGELVNIASGKKLAFSQICDVLTKVGLCARDYVDRDVDAKLSGGELKRIEIATAIVSDKKFAIFDEPEAGIDLWSFSRLADVFEDLRLKQKAVVVISHQERIFDIADRIIVLKQGDVFLDGSQKQVLPQLGGKTVCAKISAKKGEV